MVMGQKNVIKSVKYVEEQGEQKNQKKPKKQNCFENS